jgi:hypothetical protein
MIDMPMQGASARASDSRIEEQERHAYVHSLSLRLTSDQYRRLRRFVTGHEDRTNRRLTHQTVIEAALAHYLNKQSP